MLWTLVKAALTIIFCLFLLAGLIKLIAYVYVAIWAKLKKRQYEKDQEYAKQWRAERGQ